MDCRQAPSAVFDGHGTLLHKEIRKKSRIIRADLPLNTDNLLKSGQRIRKMAARQWADTHDCCLNLSGISDLTSILGLPTPGPLLISCSVPNGQDHPVEALEAAVKDRENSPDMLHVMPTREYSDSVLDKIHELCSVSGQKVVLCRETSLGSSFFRFDGTHDPRHMPWDINPNGVQNALPRFDCGPARILLAPFISLHHPEVALAAAKQGCDLAIACERSFSEVDRLLAGARTIDHLAVAVCSLEAAGIWMTPEGHQRWEEHLAGPGESCRYLLDTNRTRKKRFQDRIDFETLLHGAVQ
jgi:hypothetical protein